MVPDNPNQRNINSRICLIAHIGVAVTLTALYILALIENIINANLLCFTENSLTRHEIPCDLSDKKLTTVYHTSILRLISDTWNSKDYYIAITLLLLSLLSPCIQIVNNLRLVFKLNAFIKSKSLCSSIAFTLLNKLPMAYLFGCILFMNALYQSVSTPIITIPFTTLHQQIEIEADLAIHLLILAVVLSSIWTVYVQFEVHNIRLFGKHRYIYYNKGVCYLIVIALLLIIIGIVSIVTYFLGLAFIEIKYNDDWGLYNVVFDDEERVYGFVSVIQAMENSTLLIAFYYLYVLIMPIVVYIGCIVLCLIFKCDGFQIKKVRLMTLFFTFLSFCGFDVLILTAVLMKYLLPAIWNAIMDSIYYEFCQQLVIFSNDDNKICDDLTINITIKEGIYVGILFIFLSFVIFCLITDDCVCSKSIYSRYKSDKANRKQYSINEETSVSTQMLLVETRNEEN